MKKLLIATALVSSLGLAACSDEPAKTEAPKPAVEQKAEPAAKPAPKAAVEKKTFRSAFTTAVEEREPTDKLSKIEKEEDGRIVFFSEITGENGKTVYHVWKNGEQEVYKHPFAVGSDKWRVWSTVSQWHYAPGEIALVEIQDENGNVLDSYSIEVVEPK